MTTTYRPPSIELPDRDRRIVQLVARYGQASSKQIKQLLFHDVSNAPLERALRRLVSSQHLIRIERRIVGGARGGSGQFVYALGRRGFFMYFTGRFTSARTIRYHSLAIVDCVVTLKQAERAGRLSIVRLSSEPDCWVTVGRDELKPDLYVELVRGDRRSRIWFEVDLGTENQGQLRGKLERYRRAYEASDDKTWPVYPLVLWVAIDAERETELKWIISGMREDARPLFHVATMEGLPQFFG
jgi:hypothetical protein